MADPEYLTAARLAEMTEFTVIANKDISKLETYVKRAHSLAEGFGPFPLSEDLSGDTKTAFDEDMEIAVFLIAERLVLANPSIAAQAAGFISEKIGSYQYRASTSGEPVSSVIVPEEALTIFERWRDEGEDDGILVERTDVFTPTLIEDADEPGRKVVVEEDFLTVAPSYLDETTGRGY